MCERGTPRFVENFGTDARLVGVLNTRYCTEKIDLALVLVLVNVEDNTGVRRVRMLDRRESRRPAETASALNNCSVRPDEIETRRAPLIRWLRNGKLQVSQKPAEQLASVASGQYPGVVAGGRLLHSR